MLSSFRVCLHHSAEDRGDEAMFTLGWYSHLCCQLVPCNSLPMGVLGRRCKTGGGGALLFLSAALRLPVCFLFPCPALQQSFFTFPQQLPNPVSNFTSPCGKSLLVPHEETRAWACAPSSEVWVLAPSNPSSKLLSFNHSNLYPCS